MAAVTRIMVHSPVSGESKVEVKEYLETRGGVKGAGSEIFVVRAKISRSYTVSIFS